MAFFKRNLIGREILLVLVSCFMVIFSGYLFIKQSSDVAILKKRLNFSSLNFTSKTIKLNKKNFSITYRFMIKNKNKLDAKYNIYFKNLDHINPKYVKCRLEKNKVESTFLSLEELNNNLVIDSDTLLNDENNEYILKIWINNSDLSKLENKDYRLKLELDGKLSNMYPYQVTVTMPEDAKTERNFSWHTSYNSNTDIQLIKAINMDKNNIIFSNNDNIVEFTGRQFKDDTLGDYVHQVKVKKLKPGNKYYYRVGDKNKGIWSDIGEFITDDGDDKFKFIYISDQQSYINEIKNTTYAIRQAKKLINDAEFIVNAGDLVNDTLDKEQWKRNLNFSVYGNITTINSVGNHDYNFGGEYRNSFVNNFYYDYPKQDTKSGAYYSIDYGNTHITILNTNDVFYSKLGNTQLEWLKKDLQSDAAKKSKYKIVLMHRGVYSTGPHYYYHQDILPLTNQLTSILAENGVDLVLQGHDHVYSLTYPIDKYGNIDSVNYAKVYSEEINSNISAMYDNKSPVYFIGDSIGLKHEAQLVYENSKYLVDSKMKKEYVNLLDTETLNNYFSKFQIRTTAYNSNYERYGIFSSIEINNDNLIVNSYVVDNNNYKEAKLYNSFALMKRKEY